MPDISAIRHFRERQFAEAYFDHDDWEAQPGPFYLSCGSKYKPDFLDKRRNVLIEVVGTRQAYSVNRAKYALFAQEHPDKILEFRLPDGSLMGGTFGTMYGQRRQKPWERTKPIRMGTYPMSVIGNAVGNTTWTCCSSEDMLSVHALIVHWRLHPEDFPIREHVFSCVTRRLCAEIGVVLHHPRRGTVNQKMRSWWSGHRSPTPTQPQDAA